MSKLTATFALSTLALTAAVTEYRVRVRNLAYMQPFSPVIVVAYTPGDRIKRARKEEFITTVTHNPYILAACCLQDVALFQEGLPAKDTNKLMAEDGDNSALLGLAGSDDVAPFMCGAAVGDAPLFPGETTMLSLMVNDEICGDDAVFSLVSMLSTEANNELCTHITAPACDATSGNMEDGPGEGYIHINRGVHGVGDITASIYDWRNPIAEVFVAHL